MAQILVLFLILMVPTAVLLLARRFIPGVTLRPETAGRVGLTLLLLATASGHFVRTDGMASMLPDAVPYRKEIVIATGVLELLAAVGLWLPGMTRIVGAGLILMFLAFLPVNIYAAIERIDFGGHGMGPIYLLARVPFQFLLVLWTYWATGLQWVQPGSSAKRHDSPLSQNWERGRG